MPKISKTTKDTIQAGLINYFATISENEELIDLEFICQDDTITNSILFKCSKKSTSNMKRKTEYKEKDGTIFVDAT